MSLELALKENTETLQKYSVAMIENQRLLLAWLEASKASSVSLTQVAETEPAAEPVKEVKAKPDKKKVEKPAPAPEPEPEEESFDDLEDPEAEGSIPKLPEGKRDRAYYDLHVMPFTSQLGKMEMDKNQATLRKIVNEDFKVAKASLIPAEDWDALVFSVKNAIAELEAAASDIA